MIELRQATLQAGTFQLRNVSCLINRGEYVALMGRTGQGKTTILEAICGLRPIVSGSVHLAGCDVTSWPPGDRAIGYVPQDLALFPTLTVRDHIEFALKLRRSSREYLQARVEELSVLLGLSQLLPRRVQGLSGGESQRVALARALSFGPQLLLLDEPLSALDDETRAQMQDLLRSVHRATGVTVLHVTHSRLDAAALASRVLILQDGRIVERTPT